MKIKVAVIFGGKSVEHEVSIITANQAITSMNKEKYEIIPIYISKQGLMYTGDILFDLDAYQDLEKIKECSTQIMIVNDGEKKRIIRYPIKKFKENCLNTIDVAFPTMHGTNGEDGTIQGFLELMQIPYVGPDIVASSVGMDKIMMRKVLKESGVPCLDYVSFYSEDYLKNSESYIQKIEEKLQYPVIVKPANLGSSVGIKKAKDRKELETAIEFAIDFSDRVIVEKCITNMREINCSVIGNMVNNVASACEEPISSDEILSYADKYLGGGKNKTNNKMPQKQGMAASSKKLPADLPNEVREKIEELAKETFSILGCNGVSRVDFLIDNENNQIYVNEINTIPGALSYYLWEATGKSFEKEIDELIEIALKRSRQRSTKTYSYDQNILSMRQNGKLKGTKK